MECVILVSEKLGAVPLAECGGVVLQPGDKLLVSSSVAKAMQKHYGKALIVAGTEQREHLRYGTYEYISGGGKAVAHAAQHYHENSTAVAAVSSDKSMQGKAKMRRKG